MCNKNNIQLEFLDTFPVLKDVEGAFMDLITIYPDDHIAVRECDNEFFLDRYQII